MCKSIFCLYKDKKIWTYTLFSTLPKYAIEKYKIFTLSSNKEKESSKIKWNFPFLVYNYFSVDVQKSSEIFLLEGSKNFNYTNICNLFFSKNYLLVVKIIGSI